MKFEKEILFPAAGIDPQRADEYYEVQDMIRDLGYAVTEAARRLINGDFDENAAAEWLQKYTVNEPARAKKRVDFIRRYRSYVINYSLGEDMVEAFVNKRAGLTGKKENLSPAEQEKTLEDFCRTPGFAQAPGRSTLKRIRVSRPDWPTVSIRPGANPCRR